MADEDLRSLERAARERPDDAATGRAFARALARYGESHRELVEWLRLARLGDSEACDTIRWWGGRYGHLSRHSLPENLSVRSRPLADRAAVGIAGATRSRVVVESLEGVHLLDPESLEEVVGIAAPGEEGLVHAATCGDDVIVARGGWIALHDEKGRQLERLTLGGEIRPLAVFDGRIVVVAEHEDAETPSRLCILDAGVGLGRVLDKQFPALEFHHLIGDVLVHSVHDYDGITSNVLDPVTGVARGTFDGSVVDAQRGRFLVAGNEDDTLSEHEGFVGAPRWVARPPVPGWELAFNHDTFFATDSLALASWRPEKEAHQDNRPGRVADEARCP